MGTDPPKILVIRGGAIGDFILTLPVFRALREAFPKTALELLGYRKTGDLASGGGLVDAVRSIEAPSLASFFARGGSLDPGLQDYFGGFEIIVSCLYDPDHIFEENVRRTFKGQWIAGPHRPTEAGQKHATQVFLEPLERLAIFGADPIPRLELPVRPLPQKNPGVCLAMHPGSGSDRKNWPEKKWAQLLRELNEETRWNFLLVGGEAEAGRLERLAHGISPSRLRIEQNLSLLELAHHLQEASCFLGHDSGITHLAAALQLPCLVLWGASNWNVWKPLGNGITFLKATPLEKLEVEAVKQSLKTNPTLA